MALLTLVLAIAGVLEAQEPRFDFRSGFWISLHHYLYEQGVALRDGKSSDMPGAAYYRDAVIAKDLLREDDMTKLKGALSGLDEKSTPSAAGIDTGIAAALENAAPAYRERLWPQHDRANRAWIAAIQPLLKEHGAAIAGRLVSMLGTPWPKDSVRVDLAPYAGFAGAYATVDPPHIVIAASEARQTGSLALEILFHESSHVLIRPVSTAIMTELRSQKKMLPRLTLWHAVLFYTAGDAVKRRLPDHKPYAYKEGLWERAWPMYIAALEKHWQAYLDGKASRDDAIRALVTAVAQSPSSLP